MKANEEKNGPPPYEYPTGAPNQDATPPVYIQQGGPEVPPVYIQQPGANTQGPYQQMYAAQQPPPAQPGAVYQQPMVVYQQAMPSPPSDHLIFNIIVTLFCCWPIGIFAILKSLAVRDAINRNNRSDAEAQSMQARRLGMWTLGVGIAFSVLSIICVIVYVMLILNMNTFDDFDNGH